MAEKKESEISPLAFLNTDFLKSPAAITIRMLSEYLEPAERLRRLGIRDTIVFFGPARSPTPEQAARQLAHADQEAARTGAVPAEPRKPPTATGATAKLAR